MRPIAALLLFATCVSACGADDGAEPAPNNEGNELPPDGSAEDVAVENDAGPGDTGSPVVETDTGTLDTGTEPPQAMDSGNPLAMDVPAVRDRPTMDVRPDTGPMRMDTGPVRVDTGPPRVDTGPPRVDVPRDTGQVPVPVPGTVSPGASCHALLDRLGVRYSNGPASRGVVDPVTVTTPIEGVHYRYASFTAAERPLLMDCRLAVALVRLGRELRSRWNIDTVQHIGIYNYRVIAGTTRLSQHAYAMAIDIGGFRSATGTNYSVLTDFVETASSTCPLRSSNAVDRVLKEIACWMYDSRTFNIILTPNYNSAHRNHYHVDLTSGSHFVGQELPQGVDPPHSPFFDLLIDDE